MTLRILTIAVLAVVAPRTNNAAACENCRMKEQGFHVAEMAILGNGTVFSWAHVDKDEKPIAVGVTFTETALSGLRQDVPDKYPRIPGWEYRLALPSIITKKTPLTHVSFDWNPKGHIPPGIYDVPHFDVHFYLMPYEDRLKITAEGDDLDRCRKRPDAKYLPSGYIFAPDSEEPKMGSHWVDTQTPELSGAPFTHTFIYGTYDAKVIFFEPMVAIGYLKTNPKMTSHIKMPAAVQASGFYPTKYSVKYNESRREYTIALEEFVWIDAR